LFCEYQGAKFEFIAGGLLRKDFRTRVDLAPLGDEDDVLRVFGFHGYEKGGADWATFAVLQWGDLISLTGLRSVEHRAKTGDVKTVAARRELGEETTNKC
jgi:hypothetical protein